MNRESDLNNSWNFSFTAIKSSVADPDPDLDPHSFWSAGSTSGSALGIRIRIWIQEGQNDPQKWRNFKFLRVRCSLLRDEDFYCSLNVLYGGIGIRKLQLLIKKHQFFPLYWQKMLDPDPYPDPHWNQCWSATQIKSMFSKLWWFGERIPNS